MLRFEPFFERPRTRVKHKILKTYSNNRILRVKKKKKAIFANETFRFLRTVPNFFVFVFFFLFFTFKSFEVGTEKSIAALIILEESKAEHY